MVHFHHLLKTKKKDKMKTEILVFVEVAGSGSMPSILAPGAEEAVREGVCLEESCFRGFSPVFPSSRLRPPTLWSSVFPCRNRGFLSPPLDAPGSRSHANGSPGPCQWSGLLEERIGTVRHGRRGDRCGCPGRPEKSGRGYRTLRCPDRPENDFLSWTLFHLLYGSLRGRGPLRTVLFVLAV